MKIGLIKETKTPVDNRVALSPKQVSELNSRFPEHEIVVQESDIRAFSDEDYRNEGVQVVKSVEDCDILFGIKEAKIESLIPNKHYFFFGHIAKMQSYNRPLAQAIINKHITFSDYEYLVDGNEQRVCAFGWWAGVVGVYYTLRGYGLRTKAYELPKPDMKFTLEKLLSNLRNVKLPAVKILVTGGGRVSQGAQYVLKAIGAKEMSEYEYLTIKSVANLCFTVAKANQLVNRVDDGGFDSKEFKKYPEKYKSKFFMWAKATDILISAHYWDSKAPVYLNQDDLRDSENRICMIGDVTCDIMGSIKSTVRSSTHDNPYYDYNPLSEQEEAPFCSSKNITVMAVDTCPNALAMDTSEYFGKMLIQHVFEPLLKGVQSKVIERATIIKNGKLTERYAYLSDFAKEN